MLLEAAVILMLKVGDKFGPEANSLNKKGWYKKTMKGFN